MMIKYFIFFLTICVLVSCKQITDNQDSFEQQVVVSDAKFSLADSILQLSMEAHGVRTFNEEKFEFSFRKKRYSFDFRGKGFVYTRSDSANSRFVDDYYTESNFTRRINNEEVDVTDADKSKFESSINSVIYFATMPYKLSDAGVISEYKGQQQIKSENYSVVQISFQEEGGGEDHQDVFYYWFNASTNLIDYFAYSYETNGGGVRFRKAYNRTKVGNMTFQDYVNYEVPVGTSLVDIPNLFEKDNLKELSRIENVDIIIVD